MVVPDDLPLTGDKGKCSLWLSRVQPDAYRDIFYALLAAALKKRGISRTPVIDVINPIALGRE